MKRKIGKRARLLAFLLAAIVMLTSFSFSSVYAEENQVSDMVQKEINTDSPGEEDTTEEDKEPEKDLEKDLEIERQMKQLLKEIGVGFAESDAQPIHRVCQEERKLQELPVRQSQREH